MSQVQSDSDFEPLCQPSNKLVFFSEPGKNRSAEGGIATVTAFHIQCLRYIGPLTYIAHTATRLWKTFPFISYTKAINLIKQSLRPYIKIVYTKQNAEQSFVENIFYTCVELFS